MGDVLMSVAIALIVLGFLNMVWAYGAMRGFLRSVPSIHSPHDMDRFKRFVALQMYAALLQIAFITLPFGLAFYGMWRKYFGAEVMIAVLVCTFAILACGAIAKRVERRIQSMPVDPRFEEEFRRVVYVWIHKPLPEL